MHKPPLPSSSLAAADRVRAWGVMLLVALLAFVAYRGSFDGEFVLDDDLSVTENPSIRRLGDPGAVLSPPATSTVGGRPVSNLSFALNFAAGGVRPRGYRLVNFAIHLGAACCLFGIVRRTLRRGAAGTSAGWAARARHDALPLAAGVAALWALHPVVTSAVAYVAQRTELLMGLGYLFTLYAFIRGAEQNSSAWLATSVGACALGMGAKEVMATAPVAVLLYDRTFVAGSFAAAWRQRRGYYLALAATSVLLAYLLTTGLNQRAVGYGLGISWWRYALTEAEVVLRYIGLAFWPHPLVFDYGPAFADSWVAALPFVIGLLAVLAVVVVALRRRPAAGFAAAGFFLVLAPTSSVVPVATQPMAESRLYVPLAFALALAVVAAHAVLRRRALPVVAALALAAGLAARARNEILSDPVALWQDTLAKRPGNPRAHANYGAVLFARGRIDEAIQHAREALQRDPNNPRTHANLAAALIAKGRPADALHHGQLARQLAPPGMTDVHYQIGNALAHLGRPAEAIPHYEAELRLRPDYANAHANIGSALYLLGRPAEAIPHYERALRLDPKAKDARDNLASALVGVGRRDEAIAIYREALRERPDAVAVRTNLAIALAQAGRYAEAEAEFTAALQRDPAHAAAQRGLAEVRALRQRASATP